MAICCLLWTGGECGALRSASGRAAIRRAGLRHASRRLPGTGPEPRGRAGCGRAGDHRGGARWAMPGRPGLMDASPCKPRKVPCSRRRIVEGILRGAAVDFSVQVSKRLTIRLRDAGAATLRAQLAGVVLPPDGRAIPGTVVTAERGATLSSAAAVRTDDQERFSVEVDPGRRCARLVPISPPRSSCAEAGYGADAATVQLPSRA